MPKHPGEVLARKLGALGIAPTELVQQRYVPASRITHIVNGKRAIPGDPALRLAHWFGDEPEHWMALQARYGLWIAKTEAGRKIAELPTGLRLTALRPKSQTKSAHGRAA